MYNDTINGLTVNQLTSKLVGIAVIDFLILRRISKFTFREPNDYDPFDPEKQAQKASDDIKDDYYQRLTNGDRVNRIYNFLLREIYNKHINASNALGTFPTSIIIAIDLEEPDFDSVEEYREYVKGYTESEQIGAYLSLSEDETNFDLVIPQNKIALIVDGQHRLAGIIKLYLDAKNDSIKVGRSKLENIYPQLTNDIVISYIEDFGFNCTLLLGFDKWEQGKVFADVNFNQKPVNKSLYYDIFGSFPDPEKNDIFLAHMLAMHLNNNEKSVLRGFIKMLGTGKGYFSQAFFVEAILRHFSAKGIWSDIPFDYLSNGNKHKFLPKFFRAYFKAVKENFNDFWPTPEQDTSRKYPHILCKTTGMGALIRLINPIYRRMKTKVDFVTVEEQELVDLFSEILVKLKEHEVEFFSNKGEFAGSGSLGLQSRLYYAMAVELGYES